jgi:hypothetical protein
MQYPCKSPGCPGFVEFDPDDDSDKVPGNFSVQYLENSEFKFKIKGPIMVGKTIGSMKLIQPDHAEVKEQVIIFEKDYEADLFKRQRFYLTCNAELRNKY